MALSGAPSALVVAGTDSSGGAGIGRDVETLGVFGVHAFLAVTAVTAQTDRAVEAVEIMPPGLVARQMRAALASGRVRAIKLGMLATGEIAGAVGSVLAQHPDPAVVIDPVLVSSSGRCLMEGDVATAYGALFSLAAVITPNVPELAMLTGLPLAMTEDEMLSRAHYLVERGARAVLVKGGHATGLESIDILVTPERTVRFAAPRLDASMRGTGCALSSAIAARLALGDSLDSAIDRAKAFVFERLKRAISDSALSVDPGGDVGKVWV